LWAIELPTLTITQCSSWTLAGDFGNAARLLPQLYYSRRSVESLSRLAAFTLFAGHECNPSSVGGPINLFYGDLYGRAFSATETQLNAITQEWTTFDEGLARSLDTDLTSVKPHRPTH
jgi:hypothetical protein